MYDSPFVADIFIAAVHECACGGIISFLSLRPSGTSLLRGRQGFFGLPGIFPRYQ